MDKKYLDLSVREKISLFNGLNAWQTRTCPTLDVPSARMSDGPHGIRKEKPMMGEGGLAFFDGSAYEATCFPPACLSACSFNKNLLYSLGKALASEAKSMDVDLILGPGMNIKRSPLCGRNFEYFSEDPHLSGTLAMHMVNGIQDNHVGACIKHYAMNNQEINRLVNSSDVTIDVMNEIYLKPFEIAIKGAKPYSIMCCYNKVNGVYGSENAFLLKDTLRTKWGYKGMVVSDWGATNDVIDSFKNGLNLEMPGGDEGEINTILKGYEEGRVTLDDIHDATYPVYEFNKKCLEERKYKVELNVEDNLNTALKIAEESIVLAKNEGLLPLSKEKILVVGDLANNTHYQGGGSSHINSFKVIQPLDALKEEMEVEFIDGYNANEDCLYVDKLDKVQEASKQYNKVVLFVGTLESEDSEGYDRNNMNIRSYMIDLVKAVYRVNKNIICVIQCGAPIDLTEIEPLCKSILITYMPGCMGGEAIKNILLGQVNPSGRLAESWPKDIASTYLKDTYPTLSRDILYTEGFYVGYRYYNFKDINVLYPFGYGLSYYEAKYSSFVYEDNKIKFTLSNDNDVDVKEVIQLYVSHSSNLKYKELKYFDKIEIKAKSFVNVEIGITNDMLEYYDKDNDTFSVAKGEYFISIAKDATRDLFKTSIGQKDGFELGTREIDLKIDYQKEDTHDKAGHYSLNTRIMDMNNSFIGRIVYKVILKELRKQTHNDEKAYQAMKKSMDYMPIRGMLMSPGSMQNMSRDFLLGLVDIINGHPLRGMKKMKK